MRGLSKIVAAHKERKTQKFRASSARRSALAVRDMRATVLCGRQSCLQAAFQAAAEQTTHSVAGISPASCSQASRGEAWEIRRVSETAA